MQTHTEDMFHVLITHFGRLLAMGQSEEDLNPIRIAPTVKTGRCERRIQSEASVHP